MNKIFLILTLSICSYGLMSQSGEFKVLGYGNSECGEVVEEAERGLDSIGYLVYMGYAQGVITTLNGASQFIYGEQKNFTPKFPTLKRVIKNYCNENPLSIFHTAVTTVWVENAK